MRVAHGVTVVAGLVLASVAVAQADRWATPAPDGTALLGVLQQSDRSYALTGAPKVPKAARRPQRARSPITRDEEKVNYSCRALIEEKKYEEAEKTLATQLESNPANHDARILLGLSQHRRGEAKAALGTLRDAIIGNRRNREAWKVLGEVAATLGKKVVRPKLEPLGWIREMKGGDVEIGMGSKHIDADFPWTYYGVARAVYRYEGRFAKAHPGVKKYRFTFHEELFGVGAAVEAAAAAKKEGERIGSELKKLLRLRKRKTLTAFTFFAIYADPLPKVPERGFDALRPVLESYFDREIVVKR